MFSYPYLLVCAKVNCRRTQAGNTKQILCENKYNNDGYKATTKNAKSSIEVWELYRCVCV